MPTFLRTIGYATAIGIVTAMLVHLGPAPASADEAETGDACTGVDHSGTKSPPSPSTILLAVSTNLDTNTELSVTLQNSSTIEGFGIVDDDGRVGLILPIYSYGDYTVVSVTAMTPDGNRLTFPTNAFGGTTITIGPDEIRCDADQLAPLAVATPTPTSTTTATESPTATATPVATASSTAPPTTTGTGSTTSATSDGEPDDGSGFPVVPAILIGAGLLVALLGALLFLGAWPFVATTRTRRSTPPRETPTAITPEARDVIQGIYAGSETAGVRIAGLAQIREAHDTLIGAKDSPGVNLGQTVEISVALDADGRPIPRIEDREEFQPAESVMTIRVTPHQEHGGTFWRATVQVWDVDTARLEFGQSSGPTTAEHDALTNGRPIHEYGNDPEYHAAMLDLEATTVADAVARALGGAASGGTVVPSPR